MRHRLLAGLLLTAVAAADAPVVPQRFRSLYFTGAPMPYDGKFTMARLYYADYPGWSFDWPEMEENLGKILSGITAIKPNFEGSNIFRMDDPELLKHPIAYISEPGYWRPTESEVEGLRTFVEKGGFLIIDDFHYRNEWNVFETAMRRVLPDGIIEPLDLSHPIFHSFFDIPTLHIPYPGGLGEQGLYGEFYGIYQDNDPKKRLMVVISYNMDLGDYMEWSDRGVYAMAPTNEAYKVFINYLVYGLTH
jgi:hypothetical protein